MASTGLIVLGILAATLVILDRVNQPALATTSSPCATGPHASNLPLSQSGHPAKDFYEPTETPPLKDFAHIMGDRFVIVTYQPTLPAEQLAELRTFITGADGNNVSAGTRPEHTAVLTATHVLATLTCSTFDLPALQKFTKAWFSDPITIG